MCYNKIMSKIDEVKEEVGAIKSYLGFVVAFIITNLGFVVAFIITIGAGTIKLYLDNKNNLMIVLGILGILFLVVIFSFLAYVMHKKIKLLKEL